MGRLSDSSPPQDSTEKPPPETEELYAAPQPAQDEPSTIVVNPDRTRCETESKDDRKNAAEAEQAASLGNYFRVLSYTNAKDRVVLGMALICSIGSGVPLPLMNIVFGKMVGEFNGYFIPGTSVTEAQFKSSLCFRVIGLRVSAALRLEYMQSLFTQPITTLDQVSVGTVTNTISTLSNSIQQSISDKLAILFQSLALLITAYIIAFKYSWALTLVTSASLLFILIACSVTIPIITKVQQKVDKADEKHSSIAAEVFGSIRTVVSLGAEEPLRKKYAAWIEEARKRGQNMSIVMGVQFALMFFAMYSSFSLAFWFGLKLFREGHIENINTVITVFFSIMIAVTILGNIATPLIMVSKAASAAGSFFEMIDSERIELGGLRDPDVSAHVDIVFQNVHFTYPTRPDTAVLKGLDARFEKGKTTALVGPSGSGKSTIVALLERWYQLGVREEDHSRGTISVGEHNINSLDIKWWRSQIGLVQQEPFLFNDTIFNNVSFGLIGTKWENETEAVKRKMVEKACKEAFAEEFIKRLPKGYSTMVGENGTKLSGGQRQRLAIARSIVKQPTILILDEATSAIDVRGEKIVQAALDQVSKNRTTIVIAHRLSTIRQADHIIVMKGGVNVEQGTHDELLADEKGVYHELVHAQKLELLAEDETDESDIAHELKEEVQLAHFALDDKSQMQEETKKDKTRGFFSSIAVFAALPCTFLAAFMRIRYELQFEAMNAEVYSGSSQFAAESIEAFRTVSALTMEDAILDRYANLLRQQQNKAFRKAWYGGQLLASREYQPTSFFVIYMAIIQGGQSAGQFLSFGPNMAQATASANRVMNLRSSSATKDTASIGEKQLARFASQSGASIEFCDVAFKYASQDAPLFTGLNVRIESGQFVAFVGPSGCGKTTVISLLERFYEPFQGMISLNGQEIRSIEISSYRRALSLVAQEPRLFEGTIRENITLGLDNSDFTEDEIIQACKDAEIHDFITSLPEGYSTELGIKAQTALSGGQRQRLCIARALLRKPSLLLLDEATSSLDSQSEKVVQAALERLAGRRNMTIVAVAHRLATIQKADMIFVFGESRTGHGSRIVEQGTHQELLRTKGTYWQMALQ
ncbi:hypothetical protein APSETT445_006409 [Aspergillus pseudonomiae]